MALKLVSSFKMIGMLRHRILCTINSKNADKNLKAFITNHDSGGVTTEHVPANYILEINETYDSSCDEALNSTSTRKTSLKRHHWYVFTFS